MTDITASRTLVKSPPELWAECSDAQSLARHLGEFGEIRITKLEPETAVAWEGEEFSGTVRLEPSGWGTKVVITASDGSPPAPRLPGPPGARVTPELNVEPAPLTIAPRPGLLGRLLAWFGRPPVREPAPLTGSAPSLSEPEAAGPAVPAEPEPPTEHEQQLITALESLGQAHRRPFSHG